MKKIILLLLIIVLCGCDYNELTDLGIVSSMIIDYKNDEFIIDVEILDTNKDDPSPSYYLEGKGKDFSSAFTNLYSKTTKHLYLSHMNTVILSKSICQNNLFDIYDYFLRDSDIRKDSYFVINDNIDELLQYESPDKLSLGESLKNIIEYNAKENSHFKTYDFRKILNSTLNNKLYFIGEIVIDNNTLSTGNTYLFKNDKLTLKLDEKIVLFSNILDNCTNSFMISNDDSFEVYKYKSKTKVDDDKITIYLNCDIRLFNITNSNTDSTKDLDKIKVEIQDYLKKQFLSSIEYSKRTNYDIFNFNYLYFEYKSNLAKKDSWQKLDYDVEVNVTINEKGLTNNSLGGILNER